MRRSELRPVPHVGSPDDTTFEVWHDGAMVACVYGLDGPRAGVHIVSKYPMEVLETGLDGLEVGGLAVVVQGGGNGG